MDELCWLVIEIRSQMGVTYTPSYLPHGSNKDLPPSPPTTLFKINCI